MFNLKSTAALFVLSVGYLMRPCVAINNRMCYKLHWCDVNLQRFLRQTCCLTLFSSNTRFPSDNTRQTKTTSLLWFYRDVSESNLYLYNIFNVKTRHLKYRYIHSSLKARNDGAVFNIITVNKYDFKYSLVRHAIFCITKFCTV